MDEDQTKREVSGAELLNIISKIAGGANGNMSGLDLPIKARFEVEIAHDGDDFAMTCKLLPIETLSAANSNKSSQVRNVRMRKVHDAVLEEQTAAKSKKESDQHRPTNLEASTSSQQAHTTAEKAVDQNPGASIDTNNCVPDDIDRRDPGTSSKKRKSSIPSIAPPAKPAATGDRPWYTQRPNPMPTIEEARKALHAWSNRGGRHEEYDAIRWEGVVFSNYMLEKHIRFKEQQESKKGTERK